MNETTNENAAAKEQGAAQGPQFGLQRIYVKDLSFEAPNSPKIFLEQWQPNLNLNLGVQVEDLGDSVHEVTLKLTVTVKIEDKTAFLIEVQQAGAFLIKDLPQEQMGPVTRVTCPNILFPYAREVVSDIATRGSFPQLLLQPINFEALYAQQIKQMQEQQKQAGEAAH